MKTRALKKKNTTTVDDRSTWRPKSLRPAPKMDLGWWLDQLDRTRKSQAQVARDIGADYASFNRTLKGKRMVTPMETEKIAAALSVPHDEVLRAFGMNPDAGTVSKNVPVKGLVDERGVITMGGVTEPKTVIPPPRAPVETVALRYHTDGTHAAHLHGWVAYYAPRAGIHPEAIGRYCVVETREGQRYLRVLKRSHKVGVYCLMDHTGKAGGDIDGVRVLSAVPVSWIKC